MNNDDNAATGASSSQRSPIHIHLTALTNPLVPPALCHPHSLPPLCGLLEIISPAVQASVPIVRVLDRSAEKRTEGVGAEQSVHHHTGKESKTRRFAALHLHHTTNLSL